MTSEKLSVVEWVKTNLSKFANENVAIEMCVDELKKSRKTVRDAITRYKLTAASLLSELKSNKIKKQTSLPPDCLLTTSEEDVTLYIKLKKQ